MADFLVLMRRGWLTLVVALVICALACAGVCWGLLADEYTATSSLYVLASSETSATGVDTSTSQQLANDVAVLIETDRIMDASAEQVGLESLDDFDISVSSQTTSRVLSISVIGTNAMLVASVANALADQTAEVAVETMGLQAVNVVENAKVPEEPSGPKRVLYVAVAALAGLFVAMAFLVLRESMDVTVKSSKEAGEVFGLPVLGVLPDVGKEA